MLLQKRYTTLFGIALISVVMSVALAHPQDPDTGVTGEESPGPPPLPPGALRLVAGDRLGDHRYAWL